MRFLLLNLAGNFRGRHSSGFPSSTASAYYHRDQSDYFPPANSSLIDDLHNPAAVHCNPRTSADDDQGRDGRRSPVVPACRQTIFPPVAFLVQLPVADSSCSNLLCRHRILRCQSESRMKTAADRSTPESQLRPYFFALGGLRTLISVSVPFLKKKKKIHLTRTFQNLGRELRYMISLSFFIPIQFNHLLLNFFLF